MDAQTSSTSRDERILGSIIGLIVGDAVGTTLEMVHTVQHPITDMVGGGPFKLQPGEWTDDSSMMLLLAESLVMSGGFDPTDQLRRYLDWYRRGHLGSTFDLVDIGIQTRTAVLKFEEHPENPYPSSDDEKRAGNGSLMRLAPVVAAFSRAPISVLLRMAELSSKTTHGARACVDACKVFAALLAAAYDGKSKESLLEPTFYEDFTGNPTSSLCPEIETVVRGSYKSLEPPEIEGSGYVVKTLEAVLWSFYRTENFKDGCLKVANLGGDADTTAAIYGQLAGAFYGINSIDASWRQKLALAPYINALAAEILRLTNLDAFPVEPVSLGSIVHISPDFLACKSCFDTMETHFIGLREKLTPGPKSYTSGAAFDQDVQKFKALYDETAPECKDKAALWEDMEKRVIASYRDKLMLRLAKPKIMLPFGKK